MGQQCRNEERQSYRARLKGRPQVWRILLLLLLSTSAWLCLQHSRNLGPAFLPDSVDRGDRRKRLSPRSRSDTAAVQKRERRYDDTRNGADGKTMSEQIGWLTGQFSWDWVWQRPVSKSLTSTHWKHDTKLEFGFCWRCFPLLLCSKQPHAP